MVNAEINKIIKSLKVKLSFVVLILIAIIQSIDAIINSGFERLYGNSNPAFISLLSNNTNIKYTLIYLWIIPIILILSFANNYNLEKKIGMKNIFLVKIKRNQYFSSKILISFIYSFFICLIPLVINLIINYVFLHGGNSFFSLESYSSNEIGEYLYYCIRHPIITYIGYMISTSFTVGLLGVFCQCVCIIADDNKLPYIIVFAVWILYFSNTSLAIGDAFVPFCIEYSLKSGLESILAFIPMVIIGIVLSYIFCVVKKDEI